MTPVPPITRCRASAGTSALREPLLEVRDLARHGQTGEARRRLLPGDGQIDEHRALQFPDLGKLLKQVLRGQDPQCWKGKGPPRAAALSLWLYSAVWMWYIRTHGSKPRWSVMPWYKGKSTPAFIDAIAQLRRDLWRREIFSMSEIEPHHEKITQALIEALARAA